MVPCNGHTKVSLSTPLPRTQIRVRQRATVSAPFGTLLRPKLLRPRLSRPEKRFETRAVPLQIAATALSQFSKQFLADEKKELPLNSRPLIRTNAEKYAALLLLLPLL